MRKDAKRSHLLDFFVAEAAPAALGRRALGRPATSALPVDVEVDAFIGGGFVGGVPGGVFGVFGMVIASGVFGSGVFGGGGGGPRGVGGV